MVLGAPEGLEKATLSSEGEALLTGRKGRSGRGCPGVEGTLLL